MARLLPGDTREEPSLGLHLNKRFPVDGLKVDRSFVQKLDADDESAAIVETMLTLARALDLGVVAEGVEPADQLARLKSLGCGEGQGYYFGRPVEVSMAAGILETVFSST